jgi:hypothetical protein
LEPRLGEKVAFLDMLGQVLADLRESADQRPGLQIDDIRPKLLVQLRHCDHQDRHKLVVRAVEGELRRFERNARDDSERVAIRDFSGFLGALMLVTSISAHALRLPPPWIPKLAHDDAA